MFQNLDEQQLYQICCTFEKHTIIQTLKIVLFVKKKLFLFSILSWDPNEQLCKVHLVQYQQPKQKFCIFMKNHKIAFLTFFRGKKTGPLKKLYQICCTLDEISNIIPPPPQATDPPLSQFRPPKRATLFLTWQKEYKLSFSSPLASKKKSKYTIPHWCRLKKTFSPHFTVTVKFS